MSGAADYGLHCSGSADGCSVRGAAGAAGGGALAGGLAGGVLGAAGGLRGAPKCHSFAGGTGVLMADGSSKPISSVKVGDQVANSVPGDKTVQTHTVDKVIVTATDHDFVDVTVKVRAATRLKSAAAKVVAGAAIAAAALVGGAGVAAAAPADAPLATVTTTFHHPFYDVTQSAFVEAVDLHAGDELQTADGGTAAITQVRPYHTTELTYDLTIDGLHTYYVDAGTVPVLVHNCGNGSALDAAQAAADKASTVRPSKMRPAVAEGIKLPSGETYSSPSVRGKGPVLHPDVNAILDGIPEDDRGVGHGRCGLAICISNALADGRDPTGSDAAAVIVRGSTEHPMHGFPVGPCGSCVPLQEAFDLNFVTADG